MERERESERERKREREREIESHCERKLNGSLMSPVCHNFCLLPSILIIIAPLQLLLQT